MAKYKEILTVEQLLEFCEKQKFQHFSSKESGYQLAVKVPTTFEEVENVDENHRGMMKLKFRIFHTGLNRNGSYVSEDAAKNAMKTIADRPVLAAIHQLDDGSWDFEGHEMRIVEDENGNEELEYIESQVGSFSSEPAFWEHDDDLDKDYVCAYAYISEEYTKTAEIIRRKNGTKNSCELFIDELAFNAKEKYLELKEFFVNGSTLLGSRADGTEIGEGMLGSRADIVDFSVENNSVKYEQNDKLIETLEKLNETLSNFNNTNDNSMKGGNKVTKFELLLEQYGKTVEDITFEYEGLSDEELETAFAEAFEEPKKKIVDDDTPAKEPESDDADGSTPDVEGDDQDSDEPVAQPDDEPTPEPEEPENNESEEDSTDDASEGTFTENSIQYSVSIGEMKKDFSVSLNAQIEALSMLVNDTYADDMTWYSVEVFDKNLVMHDCWTGRAYRQDYKVKGDVYSLKGDRVEVYATWMTADEQKAFENMKANYSSIEEKLAKYEAEPEKIQILESEDYSSISDKSEFEELKKQENHFDLSVDELKKAADDIILAYAKKGQLNFAAETAPVVGVKTITVSTKTTTTKRSRYGGMGKKED